MKSKLLKPWKLQLRTCSYRFNTAEASLISSSVAFLPRHNGAAPFRVRGNSVISSRFGNSNNLDQRNASITSGISTFQKNDFAPPDKSIKHLVNYSLHPARYIVPHRVIIKNKRESAPRRRLFRETGVTRISNYIWGYKYNNPLLDPGTEPFP